MKNIFFFKKPAKISFYIYLIVFLLIVLAGILNIIFRNDDNSLKLEQDAINECISLCKIEKSKNISLIDGPCLSEEIVSNWACDITHSPKIDILDNNPINQCYSYKNGEIKHIVEVSEKCELISSK
ncbi:MAG: hypothetical protein PHR26_01195 [Candidatus ainarchaeum sp.]|nr:hypothetical protein [Candidatus ainarchaeum sp.]MDD3976257.1 hypothetical protein [Candidatus ainarchaeum sp.]